MTRFDSYPGIWMCLQHIAADNDMQVRLGCHVPEDLEGLVELAEIDACAMTDEELEEFCIGEHLDSFAVDYPNLDKLLNDAFDGPLSDTIYF